MDSHSRTAGEAGATEEDIHWVRREISSLRDSVRDLQAKARDLQAKYGAEHELAEAVRQGAVTIPQLAGALRKRAAALGRPGGLARGQDTHDFDRELFLQRELCLLATEIEGMR